MVDGSDGVDHQVMTATLDLYVYTITTIKEQTEPPSPPPCEVTVDTITDLGQSPWGIAIDPINKRMYVANLVIPLSL